MNDKYLIKTIRNEQILGQYPDKEIAVKALEGFAEEYKSVGLYLIRFDPVVIEVFNPKY